MNHFRPLQKKKVANWFCVLALFLLAASITVAQSSTGTILGAVKDPSGQVVPQAKVTARNVDTGTTRTVTTGEDGSYRMPEMPIGNYEIRTEREGFSTQVISGINLTVGQEAVVNVVMQLGSLTQTVAVTGEAPQVNTTSGSLGALVNEEQISDLPLNGRNYVDLMLLQPGINQQVNKSVGGGQIGTWFSSNGAPVRSNNMLLDGATLTNMFGAGASSASGSTLGLDGIQEWRTVTNGFSAEYGMTMGSQMIIASKGGTNVLHGTAFEYFRNNVLDAANYFYVPGPTNNFARTPPYKRNNFGASLGGPIRKDKTFVFGVYEGLRERLGVVKTPSVLPAADYVQTNNPGCGGCTVPNTPSDPVFAILQAIPRPTPGLPNNQFLFVFTQPTREDYGQVRVDHNFSAADSVFVRYTIDDAVQTQTGTGWPQFTTVPLSRNQFLTLSENHVFSAALLNTARFSFSRTNLTQDDPPSGIPVSLINDASGHPLDFGSVTIGGGPATFGYVVTAPQFVKQNIFTWSDDVFYTRGRHALKFGTLINHYQDAALRQTQSRGTVAFAGITSFLQGFPSSYSTGLTPGSVLGRTYHFNTFGFYAQDDFRLRSNLTLNLGLRYEFTDTVTEVNGHGASFHNIATDLAPIAGAPFKNPSLHNFSPRLGFAWDVMGDGKTAVRGGFAFLYDIATLGFSLFQTNIVPPFGSSASFTLPAGTPLSLPMVFPPSAAGKTLNGIQWNLKQPSLYQYNLAIDRQLPAAMAFTIAYGGSRGIHLMQTIEGNPTVPNIVNGQPFWPSNNVPRLNTNWASDQLTASSGDSWYNSLQLLLSRRLARGWQFQGAYTWAKAMDDGQGQAGGETSSTPIYPEYVQNLRLERGPSTFDVTHNFRFSSIYKFPSYHSQQGVLGTALSGWQVNGILTLESGYPFTPVLGMNRSRSGSSGAAGSAIVVDRPNLAPGRTLYSVTHGTTPANCTLTGGKVIPAGTPLGKPKLFLDPCAFTDPPAGTLGNVGRDSLRGPGLSNIDFSIIKDTPLKLREGAALEFRAEFFDLFNHPNFITPQVTGTNTAAVIFTGNPAVASELPNSNAGVLNGTTNPGTSSTGARQVQLALKLLF